MSIFSGTAEWADEFIAGSVRTLICEGGSRTAHTMMGCDCLSSVSDLKAQPDTVWGATREEKAMHMPEDDMVKKPFY
ncbi:MAG: hypothetical protein ABIK15_09180 [Pseudomonadota bacterium]